MKILHINQTDNIGGAGIAVHRLHEASLDQNIDSYILASRVITQNARIASIKRNPIDRYLSHLSRWTSLNHIYHTSSYSIKRHPFYMKADVIHFHNLHTGYFNYLALPSLTKNKPAVMTLHDMWSFTGHCAYSHDCVRWQTGCGKCPYLSAYCSMKRDVSHLEWLLKRNVFKRSRLAVVTPSRWLKAHAEKSMLGRFKIRHIPNCIDLNIYKRRDSNACKSALEIPKNKKTILVCYENIQDPRKGGDYLIEALNKLPEKLKESIVLIVMGNGSDILSQSLRMDVLDLGHIASDSLKTIVMSASDVLLFPSTADNLPVVIQESMACGTPIVAFNVGGIPEMVSNGLTGYLAELFDVKELALCIQKILNEGNLDLMRSNCRTFAEKEYNQSKVVSAYSDVYSEVLNEFSYRKK